ncbi:MAG: MarR family transcriptional regulator [Deinococcota bacterium]|nr:MarR family transcriptional regulator [Deinococcota bacterium]
MEASRPLEFLQLARLILRLSRQFQRVLDGPLTERLDFGMKGLFVLRAAQLGYHHPSRIAAFLNMASPSLSRTLERLEGRGLLERELDGEDRRRFRFAVTEEGEEAVSRARALVAETLSARYAHIEREQVLEAIAVLESLAAQMEEPGG